jgi:hypothetical protein
MIIAVTRKIVAILIFSGLFLLGNAQPVGDDPAGKIKPYRILTSGKQITVKSTKDIQSIMVWTATGHRIIEQKEVNTSSFTFTVGMNEKVFFLMLEFKGEQRFTEKIGVR